MLVFDAHLDLAMNALEWNRDLRCPIAEIRERERGMDDKEDRGKGTVCFPEMRRARAGLCMATQIGRWVKPGNPRRGWHSPEQAWAQTQGQLGWYRAMEEQGELVQIRGRAELERQIELWTETAEEELPKLPIGYILSLEGADSLYSLDRLERAYEYGLRAIGPAHYGPGTYAQGTEASGGIGARGRELLKEMERLNMILDASHLCDESFWEAMDAFGGRVWASHSNCRALVPRDRQFTDAQIKLLIERGAVIGAVFDGWMTMPGWKRGGSKPAEAGFTLERMVDHIDHISQIAGNASHCGLGTDLDGAFGRERCPADVDTIAALQKLPGILYNRGYKESDAIGIMHGNFVRFLRESWN